MISARRFARRALRQDRTKRSFLRSRLFAEQLETRALMAGDFFVSDYWNGAKPADVNADTHISPVDALLVINQLNNGGSQQLQGVGGGGPGPVNEGEGEGAAGGAGITFYDVNNDGFISPIDALMVINALNGEGEPPLVQLRVYVVNVGTQVSELATPPSSITSIAKGQDYEMVVTVKDLRSGSPLGIGATHLDVLYDKPLTSVFVREARDIVFNGSVAGGSFTLSFRGQTTPPININPADPNFLELNREAIEDALEALPTIGLGNVFVTVETGGRWRVQFDNALGDQNIPNTGSDLLTVNGGGLIGGGTATVDQIADGVLTDPVAFEEAFRSRDLYPTNNAAFYRDQPLFNADDASDRVDGLGGSYFTLSEPFPRSNVFEREVSRVRMNANVGGFVFFTPSIENLVPGQETAVYTSSTGERTEVDPALISLGPDLGFGVGVVRLEITEQLAANDDLTATVNEDFAAGVIISVLANDVKNAGAPPGIIELRSVNSSGITGTVTIDENGTPGNATDDRIKYVPAANFTGIEEFTYTIGLVDGTNHPASPTDTATVRVTVNPVNDAPRIQLNGVDVTAATADRDAEEDINFVFNAANNSLLSINDVDGGTASTNIATLTVTGGTLTLGNTTGLNFTAGGNGTSTMTFNGSLANINNALNGLTYDPNLNVNGITTLTITYNDKGNTGGGDLIDSETLDIDLTAVNDAPVNAVPGQQTVDESPDTLTFSTADSNRITVDDVDAGSSNTFEVEVRVLNGALNIVNTANVIVQNNNTALVTITGTFADINNALNGMIYSPAASFVGLDTLTITSDDDGATGTGGAKMDLDTVSIDVIASVRPRARPDSVSRTESDGPIDIDVMFNDFAHIGAIFETTLLSVTSIPASRGTVQIVDPQTGTTLDGDLTDDLIRYTPPAGGNFFGTVTFQYTINDTYDPAIGPPLGLPDANSTTTVTITIDPENDPPTAVDDGPSAAYTTNEDVALNVTQVNSVLNNDTDPDNQVDTDGDGNIDITDTLEAVIVTNPANGQVTLNLDGTFTYTPNQNFNGPDSFTYRARDEAGALSNIATVSLNVTALNDKPVGGPDTYSIAEDGTLTADGLGGNPQGVLFNDNDGDPELTQALTAQLVAGSLSPVGGTLNFNTDGTFTYTPPANFNGPVTFQYRADDAQAQNSLSDPVTVTINVNAVNDQPTGSPDSYTMTEDATLTANGLGGNPVGVLNNDNDGDPEATQTLTAQLVAGSLTPGGSLTLNPNGTFTYTPPANFNGIATFQYQVNDNQAANNLSAPVTVTISIGAVNDVPVASPDSGPTFNTTEDVPLTVAAPGVLGNDDDGDPEVVQPLLAQIVPGSLSPAGAGTLTLSPDGSVQFNPTLDFSGTVTFQYRANDQQAVNNLSAPVTVTIVVGESNDPPDAVDDDFTAIKDFVDQQVDVLANDTFAPDVGETLKVIAVQGVLADANGDTPPQATSVLGGTVRLDNFVVLYNSPPGHEGADSFTYTITDSRPTNPLTDTATVNVDVLAFIPKIIEGIVYQDSDGNGLIHNGDAFTDTNGNGVYDGDGRIEGGNFIGEPFALNSGPRPNNYDPPERRLQGITVELFGFDFQGNPVGTAGNPLQTQTDADGRYQFLGDATTQFQGLKPGTYTVREVHPAYLIDGLETESSLLASATGNDTFVASWGPEDFTGNITGLNFAEGSFNTNAATGGFTNPGGLMADAVLASSRRNGLVIALDASGDSIWTWSMPGWDNLHHFELILDADTAHATLRVWDNANAGSAIPSHIITIHQETVYNGDPAYPNSPPDNSLARFRILGSSPGGVVIRLDGTAEEFGLDLAAAAPGEGEGEGEAVDPNYAEAVDAVFSEGEAWA